MHLSFYMFIYFGKIDLSDTWYFSKKISSNIWLMLWCQGCILLSWSSEEIYAASGIFNCRLQFSWLKIALCVLVNLLTILKWHNWWLWCLKSLPTGSLMVNVAIIWSFIYFLCKWWHFGCCQKQHKWLGVYVVGRCTFLFLSAILFIHPGFLLRM